MFEKIKNIFRSIGIFFAFGMKAADEQILHSGVASDDANTGIHQEQNEHRVAHHLLKGEVTQEVQELAYRTVLVDRESQSYEVYSPMKAIKTPKKLETTKAIIFNEENYEVLLIQENHPIGDNVLEALNKIKEDDMVPGKNTFDIGKIPPEHRFTITVGRSGLFRPRYIIEEYTKKIVCLVENKEENKYILDFYVSKYPDDKKYKTKGFVREIERIMKDGRGSDVTEIRTVDFITSHSYKFFDGILFKFTNLKFNSVHEFDGNYVIRYNAEVLDNGEDFFDGMYSETMAKKYETKAPKDCVISIDPNAKADIRKYTCSVCGKEVFYDASEMDEKAASLENEENGNEVTEFMDMETSEQTFGKMMCRECMLKHQEELMKKLIEEK